MIGWVKYGPPLAALAALGGLQRVSQTSAGAFAEPVYAPSLRPVAAPVQSEAAIT
jgi:hypothetical protein